MPQRRIVLLVATLNTLAVTATAAEPTTQPAVSTVVIEQGDLKVTFQDNSESPKPKLSGIQELINVKAAPGFDAFDPNAPGSSAGLNFEHIIAGHESPYNKFSPRHGRYTLYANADGRSVTLVRRAEDSPWAVSSTLTYTVTPPHFIDFDFQCVFHDKAKFGKRGWAIFFFADYMNQVQDVALHFRGIETPGADETWIAADAPEGTHPHWRGGGTYRYSKANPLEYDEDVSFRLNSWSYDWPRFTGPFYYGRAAHDMTYILMFDRTMTDVDEMRFSLFKFKVHDEQRKPAWDFQYVVRKIEEGRPYGFRGRAVWKQFISPDDCRNEYRQWSATTR